MPGWHRGLQVRRDEAQLRARVLQDVGELLGMQLGVHRHRGQAGVPAGEQDLVELRAVPHRQRNAVTFAQVELLGESGSHARYAARHLPVGAHRALADRQRRTLRLPAGAAQQQMNQIHAGGRAWWRCAWSRRRPPRRAAEGARHRAQDVRQEGGLVAPRLGLRLEVPRREVGRVGLEQQPVARDLAHQLDQVPPRRSSQIQPVMPT